MFEQMTSTEKNNVCVGLLTGLLMRDIVKMTRMSQPTLAKLIKEGRFLEGVSLDAESSTDEEDKSDEESDHADDTKPTKHEEEATNLFLELKRLNTGRSLKRRNATDEAPQPKITPRPIVRKTAPRKNNVEVKHTSPPATPAPIVPVIPLSQLSAEVKAPPKRRGRPSKST